MRDDIMSTRKGLIEKKHTDKLSLHQRMPASNIGLGSMKGLEDSIAYEETEYPTVLSNKAMSKNQHRTDEEECDGSKSMCHKPKNLLHYKSEMKVEANPLRRPGIAGKRMDEIESDSNVLDSKFLDIKVNTIDRNKQTFVLKNDGNLCVTYFEKSFILAECRQSKRQVFKLVEVEEVMNRLNPKGRPMEEDTIEGEKEESSSEENEENKFDRENSKSKFKRENSKPDKKDKKKKRPSKSEEDLTESVEYAEKIERVFPENLREVHLKDINSLYNPQNQMKANMEHQCRDLLNRNLGRLDVLPEECKRLLETPANPMMARTTLPRGGISGFSMVKTNYVPARKRSQNDVQKEKASIYEVNRTNNILTRLEKALRT
ncbi:uncharacterized protein VICG_00882 [Vittaforma corneae ATCC 50505]|uniref:Uncharacterized protein n=1 Tax=Vittaforma corneae (strain ATCC 50505) TaxID=993615 RepID=L2GNG3_VITCO|nr:uncharacterized protein VICG_00882 [Vittaforma corneae ATCC 50505]ELA42035.1 hypothetical protein VICG_00882 [Vittaforma corneae ATCC 50505]